jgi:PST family polysaccharide transporter
VSDQQEAPPSLTQSVKSGVAWSTFTFGLSKALAFLSVLVLTRLLEPSQFGVVGAVVTVLSFIEINSDLGMKATVIYEQEKGSGERVQTAFTMNLALAVVLTGVGVVVAPYVASFFHASRHAGLFRLASLDITLTALGGIHDGLLLRDLRFRTRIVTEGISALVRAGVGIVLAVLGFGAASLVWGLLAGTTAWMIAQWMLTPFRPNLHFHRKIASSMVHYGIGASMLSVLAQFYSQLDPTVVGRVLGTRALGLYTVAFRLPTLVLENIAYQVSLVAFPALSRKRVTDSEGVGASTHRLIRYQSFYSLPLAAGMAVLALPIVEVVFSPKWRDAAGVLAAVSILSGISASTFALGDGFKALGRQRVMVIMSVFELPLVVVTIILAAPYGITTVAWARAGSEILWAGLMVVAARWVLRLSVRGTLASVWPGTAAAIGVVALAGPVRLWSGLPRVPMLIVGTLAGTAGALIAVAVLAPAMFVELRDAGANLRRRLPFRRVSAPPRASSSFGPFADPSPPPRSDPSPAPFADPNPFPFGEPSEDVGGSGITGP